MNTFDLASGTRTVVVREFSASTTAADSNGEFEELLQTAEPSEVRMDLLELATDSSVG